MGLPKKGPVKPTITFELSQNSFTKKGTNKGYDYKGWNLSS